MLQHLYQPDSVLRDDNTTMVSTQMITSTSKRVPSEQVAISEFSIPTAFIFNVWANTHKRAFITDALSFTESSVYSSTNLLTFQNHGNDNYSILLIGDHHDFYLYFTHHETCDFHCSFSELKTITLEFLRT